MLPTGISAISVRNSSARIPAPRPFRKPFRNLLSAKPTLFSLGNGATRFVWFALPQKILGRRSLSCDLPSSHPRLRLRTPRQWKPRLLPSRPLRDSLSCLAANRRTGIRTLSGNLVCDPAAVFATMTLSVYYSVKLGSGLHSAANMTPILYGGRFMVPSKWKCDVTWSVIGAISLCVACLFLGCRRPEVASESGAEENGPAGATSTAGQPSFMPVFSTSVPLRAGEVKSIAPGVSGPMSVRVMVNTKERVSFGLVRKSELSNYSTAKQLEAAMESLPCASGGTGNMTRSCELGETDKDFTLVVADLRDSSQATRDLFDEKMRSQAAASFFSSVEVTIWVAVPSKGTSGSTN